jgi:hypothetical protein
MATTSIPELDRICHALQHPKAQSDLVFLYSNSQIENCYNGKITQEIGRSRENDLKAVLQLHIGDEFVCDVDGRNLDNGADCMFQFTYETPNVVSSGIAQFTYETPNVVSPGIAQSPISIKHISDCVGKTGIKAKWTSDQTKATEYIEKMKRFDPVNYTHMLCVYIDVKKTNTITIIGISAEQMMNAVCTLGDKAFKTSFGTNTRGVEYSKEMMTMLLDTKYFQVVIPDVVLHQGLNPIQRRQLLLSSR